MITAYLSVAAMLVGAAALYLSAPHQASGVAVPGKWMIAVGVAAIVTALLLLLSIMGAATAVFTWVVGLMLLWSVPPVAIAWWRYRGGQSR